jgi:hypothetical protein
VSDPSSPVDPKDLALLRAHPPPAIDVKARVRSRLAAAIPSIDGGGDYGGPAGGSPPRTAAGLGSIGSKGAIAAAFLIGGALGAALYARLARAPGPQVVYVERPVAAPPPSSPPSALSAPTDATSAPAASATTSTSAARSPSSTASQLSAERMILDEARAALGRHDAARALDELDRHRRTFPKALLAEERDAMQVQALVAAGRYDEARLRANAFRRHTHDSLFLPVVDAAIGSIP